MWGPQSLTNHGVPNTKCANVGGLDYLYATEDIEAGSELLLDYRTVCDAAARGECDYADGGK